MQIVDLKTFLEMPDGIVFAEYKPCIVDKIQIRGQAVGSFYLPSSYYTHFGLFDTSDSLYGVGEESPVETDQYSRVGPGLDPNQLFAVFDKKDIAEVIERLQRVLIETA